MDNNVIYLSDASYDVKTKEAGLGIKNLTTGVSHSVALSASSILEAEEFALLEAINHAVVHHHRNCIFVYDNINIDTAHIGAFYAQAFDMIQFLWMKRDYLKQVDKLACNVRLKRTDARSYTKQIRSLAATIQDEELIETLMCLTRGETYGYLCALSGRAPMYKAIPHGIKEVNAKIIALLFDTGNKTLRVRLLERYRHIRSYKHNIYDELLKASGFDMSWFEEAKYECHNVSRAA